MNSEELYAVWQELYQKARLNMRKKKRKCRGVNRSCCTTPIGLWRIS